MRIEIDGSAFVKHKQELGEMKARTRKDLWTALRATSIDMERHIKSSMPVDTGRARASWGRWTPSDLQRSNSDAKASDAVYQEDSSDLEITQGTNVEYVGRLNAGHSQQAPAGFIDMAVEMAKVQLERLAEAIGRR